MISTQYNTHVQTIRLDDGSEFLGHYFQRVLKSNGIYIKFHVFTPINRMKLLKGSIKYLLQYLLKVARSLMFYHNFPRIFLGFFHSQGNLFNQQTSKFSAELEDTV